MLVRYFSMQLNTGFDVNPVIRVNEYDEGEKWVFTLLNGNTQYIPDSGSRIIIQYRSLQHEIEGTIDDLGRVVFIETQDVTISAGFHESELLIDGGAHGTANFYIFVEDRPLLDSAISANEISYFETLVQQTGEYAQSAESAAQSVAGYVDFSGRTATTQPDNSDIFALESSGNDKLKIDYEHLAKAIVETYAGSTLAGSEQSIQSALAMLKEDTGTQTLNSAIVYRKKRGWVWVRVLQQGGDQRSGGYVLGTLPEGFRPSYSQYQGNAYSDADGWVIVNNAGSVTFYAPANKTANWIAATFAFPVAD